MATQIVSQVYKQAVPDEAAAIDGFDWYAVLDSVDVQIVGTLFYRPTVKRVARWEAAAEYYGFKFYVNLYQEDIDFLNRVLNLDITHDSAWLDTLPTLDIGIRRFDAKHNRVTGVRCVWNGKRVVYADPAIDALYAPVQESDMLTVVKVSPTAEPKPWLVTAFQRSITPVTAPQPWDWLPAEAPATGRPNFVHPRDIDRD